MFLQVQVLGQVVRYGYCNTVSNQGVCWFLWQIQVCLRWFADMELVLLPNTILIKTELPRRGTCVSSKRESGA